jgi:hypothetical protein
LVQRGQVPGRKGMTQETITTVTNKNNGNNTQDREVVGNRPDIIIKQNMPTNRCVNTSEQKCHAKGCIKYIQIDLICGDKTNVEHEMCDRISNNWSHRISKKGLQKN